MSAKPYIFEATTKRIKMIIVSIPDIDLTKKVKCYNKRWDDKYKWLLNGIIYQQITQKKSFTQFVPLSSEMLQKYLGTRYSKFVISQLINSKIIEAETFNYKTSDGKIETRPKYNSGKTSNGAKHCIKYRLCKDVAENHRIKSVRLKKGTFERKIIKHRTQTAFNVLRENPNLKHEFLQLTQRRIDVKKAMEYINNTYEIGTPRYESRKAIIHEFDAMHLAKISEHVQNVQFNFSYKGGRVYSPATSLSRDLEQFTYFIGYENEKTISADMPNSQLCFYDLFLQSYNAEKTGKKHASNPIAVSDTTTNDTKKVHNIGSDGLREGKGFVKLPAETENLSEKYNPYSLAPPSLPMLCTFTPQNTWQTLVSTGIAYDKLMQLFEYNGKTENHTKEERNEFKPLFFGQLFYNRYIPNYDTPLELCFKKHFYNDYVLLKQTKYRLDGKRWSEAREKQRIEGLPVNEKHIGNSKLAIQVQAMEGKFFHTEIVHFLRRSYIDVPFTIKHDSVILPMSHASYIVPELNRLLKRFFNNNNVNLKCSEL